MYGEDCCASGGAAAIDAPFIGKTFKAKFLHRLVESDVPNATGLFHAVETFLKLPHPVFLSGFFEARWLFHKNGFTFGKDTMKEGGFNVKMLYVPVEDGSNVHQHTKGLKTCCGGGCFVVVNEISLCESLCDITYFVTRDVAHIITFAFTNQFPF